MTVPAWAVVFVDTGPLVALYVRDDPDHATAERIFAALDKRRTRYVTSYLVLSETFTMLGHHVGHDAAAAVARGLFASNRWKILRPEPSADLDALGWFTRFDDQEDLSFCDCVSFVLMEQQKLRRVVSFDHHFDLADFERVFSAD